MDLTDQVRSTFQRIEKLLHDIEADAVFDGVYSDDEKQLIRSIFGDCQRLEDLIHHILDDDHITDDELNRLRIIKTQLSFNADQVAGVDGIISEDEKEMLVSVARFLDDLPY